MHCLLHCRHLHQRGHLPQLTHLPWHSTVSQSPQFTLGVTLGVAHSMDLDKHLTTCIHHYQQRGFPSRGEGLWILISSGLQQPSDQAKHWKRNKEKWQRVGGKEIPTRKGDGGGGIIGRRRRKEKGYYKWIWPMGGPGTWNHPGKTCCDTAPEARRAPLTEPNGKHQLEVTDAGTHSQGFVKRN